MKKRFLICCVCLICLLTVSAMAAAPVIIAQPQNYYFPSNQEFPAYAYFNVLASGDDLSYQWQVSRDSGNSWSDASNTGSTSSSYSRSIPESGTNGGQMFRCVVSNSDGSVVSSAVTVSVGAYVLDSLPQLLSYITDTGNAIFDWVGQSCTTIVSEPLLLFTIGFLALGGCIALVGRLLSRS